jgi:hypothetical protein
MQIKDLIQNFTVNFLLDLDLFWSIMQHLEIKLLIDLSL